MPTQVITTSATFQLKTGPGYITRIAVIAPGTTWTLQVKDGPIGATSGANSVFAASAFTLTAANPLLMNQPLYCPNGIQIITAGATPGELDVDWY